MLDRVSILLNSISWNCGGLPLYSCAMCWYTWPVPQVTPVGIQSQAKLTWIFKDSNSPSFTIYRRDTYTLQAGGRKLVACKQHSFLSIPMQYQCLLGSEPLTQARILATYWFKDSHFRRISRHQHLYLSVLLTGAELTVMQKPRVDKTLQIQNLLSSNSCLLHGSNTTTPLLALASTGYKKQTTTDTTSCQGWFTTFCPASHQRHACMF